MYASRAPWKRSFAEHVYDGKTVRKGTTLRMKEWRRYSKEHWGVWKLKLARRGMYEEGDKNEIVEKDSQEMAQTERH